MGVGTSGCGRCTLRSLLAQMATQLPLAAVNAGSASTREGLVPCTAFAQQVWQAKSHAAPWQRFQQPKLKGMRMVSIPSAAGFKAKVSLGASLSVSRMGYGVRQAGGRQRRWCCRRWRRSRASARALAWHCARGSGPRSAISLLLRCRPPSASRRSACASVPQSKAGHILQCVKLLRAYGAPEMPKRCIFEPRQSADSTCTRFCMYGCGI